MTSQVRSVDGLFFDLYGTLLIYGDMDRAWEAWLTSLHGMFREFGLTLSREDFEPMSAGLFSRPVSNSDGSDLTLYESRLLDLAREVSLDPSSAQLGEAAMRSIAAWHEFVTLDPAVPNLLTRLGECVPLALISNFDHPPHIHRMLEDLDLKKQFANVTISAEIGFAKPDPRIFSEALATTGLDPRHVVYVGDTDDDIKAAAGAGMIPILIRRTGVDVGSAGQDYRTTSPQSTIGADGSQSVTVISELAELEEIIASRD